jgi:hypothetical protein
MIYELVNMQKPPGANRSYASDVHQIHSFLESMRIPELIELASAGRMDARLHIAQNMNSGFHEESLPPALEDSKGITRVVIPSAKLPRAGEQEEMIALSDALLVFRNGKLDSDPAKPYQPSVHIGYQDPDGTSIEVSLRYREGQPNGVDAIRLSRIDHSDGSIVGVKSDSISATITDGYISRIAYVGQGSHSATYSPDRVLLSSSEERDIGPHIGANTEVSVLWHETYDENQMLHGSPAVWVEDVRAPHIKALQTIHAYGISTTVAPYQIPQELLDGISYTHGKEALARQSENPLPSFS